MSSSIIGKVKSFNYKLIEKSISALQIIIASQDKNLELGALKVFEGKVIKSGGSSSVPHFLQKQDVILPCTYRESDENSSSDEGFLTASEIIGLSSDFMSSSMDF